MDQNSSTSTNRFSDFDLKTYEELMKIINPPEEILLGIIVTNRFGTDEGYKIYNPLDVDTPEFYMLITEHAWNKIIDSAKAIRDVPILFMYGIPVFMGDNVAVNIINERFKLFLADKDQLKLIKEIRNYSITKIYFSSGV